MVKYLTITKDYLENVMEELVLQLIKSIGKCGFAIANDSIKQTTRQSKHYKFRGVLDFWYNGINNSNISLGDYVSFTCQISPLLQLFPNNPFRNARRWNKLYTNDISNEIKNQPMSTIVFYVGSDMAVRFNQEGNNLVTGLYELHGDIGQGIMARINKAYLIKKIPNFLNTSFYGCSIDITAQVGFYPIEHTCLIAQVASKANLNVNFDKFKDLPYLDIKKIRVSNCTTSLIGTPWIATNNHDEPFIVRYCQFDNQAEWDNCTEALNHHTNVIAYYDELQCPSGYVQLFKTHMN